MSERSLSVIGLGFMGGSIAAAARKHAGVSRVIGVDPDSRHREIALEHGLIEEAFPSLCSEAVAVDLVVVCAPVNCIADLILEASKLCSAETLLTDIGSTRGRIESAVRERLPKDRLYIGGHPLAGSEKHGPEESEADLFQNRKTILTGALEASARSRATDFWTSLGAVCCEMSASDHDRALAFTSHLPHLLSYALCQVLPSEYRELTASGFRDMSRLAGSDVELWMPIIEHNQDAVSDALSSMVETLTAMRDLVSDGSWDQLSELLMRGHQQRPDSEN